MIRVLQKFILPSYGLPYAPELYYRSEEALVSTSRTLCTIPSGKSVDFGTFFNSFSISRWKDVCANNLNNLQLRIQGQGALSCHIYSSTETSTKATITSHQLSLTPDNNVSISLPTDLDGIIGVEFLAQDNDASLEEVAFITSSPVISKVHLGIVITHFNRQSYVRPAILRLQNELLNDPLYRDKVKVAIVDNSCNLSLDGSNHITLIPNRNLGGSGGFTRGLLHFKDSNWATHCLFMDDDASCEVESIRRTVALLELSTRKNTAVGGALLKEEVPYELYEKGAHFQEICRPLFKDYDMRDPNSLIQVDSSKAPTSDYGAWWFFAFRIDQVSSYPFPFFVRGDDILFSLMNEFHQVSLNGVACWGESFSIKHSPMTAYLDARSHLLISQYAKGFTLLALLAFAAKTYLLPAYSYNYQSAWAAIRALNDYSSGPLFWKDNLDMSGVRKQIQNTAKPLQLLNVPLEKLSYDRRSETASTTKQLIRFALLHGALRPSFLLKNTPIMQEKSFNARLPEVHGYKHIYYFDPSQKRVYEATMDRKALFLSLMFFLKTSLLFIAKYSRLKRSYNIGVPEMTSEKFWRNIYAQETSEDKS